MTGRRVDLADQLHQAGISIVGIGNTMQEDRLQVCAVALGCSPRLPTKQVMAVLRGRSQVLSRVVVASWCACQVSLPLVVLCDANARVGFVASLAVGDQAADFEDTAGAEFHAMLLEWDLCLPATLPGPHNDPAKPSGTWCSRARWHRIDFVAVPRNWLAGVKRAEVEAAVALLGSGSFDHAMPIVEVVFRLRRQVTNVQEVLTLLARLCGDLRFASRSSFFWSQAPLVPSELSVDERAELLAEAARVAWGRAAPRVQAAPQADWMDEETWQAVRAHAVARRAHQKARRAWLKTFFCAVEVCSEARQ